MNKDNNEDFKEVFEKKINNRKNGRKILFILFVLLIFTFVINSLYVLPKYRFGYIFKGPRTSYKKIRNTKVFFELNNGNIFILGKNWGNDHSHIYDVKDRIIPSEIYDIKTNKIKTVSFPDSIQYDDNAILLENNRLLLINAFDPSLNEYKNGESFPYDSMAIINLDSMQIEKIIKKQLNVKNKPYPNPGGIYLGNNKVMILQYGEIELFDLNNGTSKILKQPEIEKGFDIYIPVKEDKLLIFNLSFSESKTRPFNNVYEYNYKTEKIKLVGKIIKRELPYIKKIDDNRIVILGGSNPRNSFEKVSEIELYDINTNKSEVISNMLIERCTDGKKSGFATELFNDKYLFIIGGKCNIEPIFGIKTDKKAAFQSEILNIETRENYLGPKLQRVYLGQDITALNNGNLLISSRGGTIQIFKPWRNK